MTTIRFRDEIARLEVDVVALEMLVLRVLSAEKSARTRWTWPGLLKIKGSEIQQRYSELMMLAAGPFALPFIDEAMEAGWQGDFPGGDVANAPAGRHLLQHAQDHHLRRLATKCSATSWRKRSSAELVGRGFQQELRDTTWISISLTTSSNCATPCASWVDKGYASSAAAASWPSRRL
jgi:hypothetical protein